MWERRNAGRTLTFHLAGINNQNFIMRDEETGSFWQQVSGRAVSGPLKGAQLTLVPFDELSYSIWRTENPDTQVLAPVASMMREYAEDWEPEVSRLPTPVAAQGEGIMPPRAVVIGAELGSDAKAYPFTRLQSEKVIQDRLAGVPIAVVLGPDDKSVRVFRREVNGKELDLFRDSSGPWALRSHDPEQSWNFAGCNGENACLQPVQNLKEFWFDWHRYHSDSKVY